MVCVSVVCSWSLIQSGTSATVTLAALAHSRGEIIASFTLYEKRLGVGGLVIGIFLLLEALNVMVPRLEKSLFFQDWAL